MVVEVVVMVVCGSGGADGDDERIHSPNGFSDSIKVVSFSFSGGEMWVLSAVLTSKAWPILNDIHKMHLSEVACPPTSEQ